MEAKSNQIIFSFFTKIKTKFEIPIIMYTSIKTLKGSTLKIELICRKIVRANKPLEFKTQKITNFNV